MYMISLELTSICRVLAHYKTVCTCNMTQGHLAPLKKRKTKKKEIKEKENAFGSLSKNSLSPEGHFLISRTPGKSYSLLRHSFNNSILIYHLSLFVNSHLIITMTNILNHLENDLKRDTGKQTIDRMDNFPSVLS